MAAPDFTSACVSAHALFPKNCSGAVKFIAKQFGFVLPELQANALIDYFNSSQNGWTPIGEDEAVQAASNGKLVIAGKKATPQGHIVVVMPGAKARSGGYTYVDKKGKSQKAANHGLFPVSCSTSIGSWPGGVSKGDKTVFDAWGNVIEYRDVKYWLAPLRTLDFQKLSPGFRLRAKAAILPGRIWDYPAANSLTTTIPAGSEFIVGGVQITEKWADVQAKNFSGLRLHVSAREACALFEPI